MSVKTASSSNVMQRKFITNLALVLVLNLLIKPFWILGVDRSVQNAVGTDAFGIYYALFNFSFLLNIILDVGITNFNNTNISQNNHLLNKHLSSIIVLRFLLAGIYLIVTMIVGFVIGYDTLQLKILIFMAFNQVLISFILYLRSNIAGLHLFKTDSVISVLDRLIMIMICGMLLWGHVTDKPFQIEWYIYAQTASYLVTLLITAVIVIDRARLKRLRWNMPFFLMILKKSYPYAILVLLMTFYNRIDTVMLERLLPNGAEQSGVYASAYRLLDAANMIAFLFAGLLLPMFARMIKLRHSVEHLVKLAVSLLLVPAIIVACGSFVFQDELMGLLYKNHVGESADVFGILMSCFMAVSTTYIFGTLLTANGNLKQLNYMASAGMVLNIIVNLILIPRYMALGTAISSFATQFLTATAQVIMAQRIFKFKINYKFIGKMLFLFILACCIFWSAHDLYRILCSLSVFKLRNLHHLWVPVFGISVTAIGLMSFVLGIISIRSIRHILLNEK